ncbi:MAG: flagellar protein FliS [Lachnospiraceae bacterium]|jgi:flagellar protein FliS|nr:flagellar protein FliS [Lachnospiraceae bacterium]
MSEEQKQEFTLRIAQANSTALVVILYDMILSYLADAKEHCLRADDILFSEDLRKARGCIQELIASLNGEYEVADNLKHLYWFAIRRLAQCQYQHDAGLLKQLNSMFTSLRDAYATVAKEDDRLPVMDHSQTIYAGLTYGRNQLTENVTDSGTNRGFCV